MKTSPFGCVLSALPGWLYSGGLGPLKVLAGSRRQSGRRGGFEIGYTSVLLAVVVGIVHAGLSPEIEIAGVHPNLLLVAVVLVTALVGFGPGVIWAFAGGLTANLLTNEPLGAVPLSLLLVAAMVAGGDRLFGRLIWIYPILAAFAGSILADLVILGIRLMAEGPMLGNPIDLILPAAVLNAAITGVLLYPARMMARRLVLEERPAW
ncbi:MAG TPA: rod shape-determining protein MreD [Candidatus Limnocylindria bacterium]